MATISKQTTEEEAHDLRQRAQWLKRYAEEHPHTAGTLNTVANKLEAEARALEAEPALPDNE